LQEFYRVWHALPTDARPTAAHRFIRLLEQRQVLRRCVSQVCRVLCHTRAQNFDGLESAAGVSDSMQLHPHGRRDNYTCIGCGQSYPEARAFG